MYSYNNNSLQSITIAKNGPYLDNRPRFLGWRCLCLANSLSTFYKTWQVWTPSQITGYSAHSTLEKTYVSCTVALITNLLKCSWISIVLEVMPWNLRRLRIRRLTTKYTSLKTTKVLVTSIFQLVVQGWKPETNSWFDMFCEIKLRTIFQTNFSVELVGK